MSLCYFQKSSKTYRHPELKSVFSVAVPATFIFFLSCLKTPFYGWKFKGMLKILQLLLERTVCSLHVKA